MDPENQEYSDKYLKDIIEPLFFDLTVNRPKDIINYSLSWLMRKGGYNANGKIKLTKVSLFMKKMNSSN